MKLDDVSRWARGDGLQAVLIAIGAALAALLARLVHRLARRVEAAGVLRDVAAATPLP